MDRNDSNLHLRRSPWWDILNRAGFRCAYLVRWSQFQILFLHGGHELVEVLEHQRDVFLELNGCPYRKPKRAD